MRVKVKECDVYITRKRGPDVFLVISKKQLEELKASVPKRFQKKMVGHSTGVSLRVLNGRIHFED